MFVLFFFVKKSSHTSIKRSQLPNLKKSRIFPNIRNLQKTINILKTTPLLKSHFIKQTFIDFPQRHELVKDFIVFRRVKK